MIEELEIRVMNYSNKLEGMIKNFRVRDLNMLDENGYLKNQLTIGEKKYFKEVQKYAEERGVLSTKVKEMEIQNTHKVNEIKKSEINYQDSISTLRFEKDKAYIDFGEDIEWHKKNTERLEAHINELTEIVSMNRSSLDDKDEQIAGLNDRIQQIELELKDKFSQ